MASNDNVIIVNPMLKNTQGYAGAPFFYTFAQNNWIMYRNWFKAYVIDVLPSLSIILYIIAIIYNVSFYSEFGIKILDYVSFAELVNDILLQVIGITFFFVLFTIGFYTFLMNCKKNKRRNSIFFVRFIKTLKKLKNKYPRVYFVVKKFFKKNRIETIFFKRYSLFSLLGVYSAFSFYLFYKNPVFYDTEKMGVFNEITLVIISPLLFIFIALVFVQLFSRQILTINLIKKILRNIHISEYVLSFLIFFIYICSVNYLQSKRDAQHIKTAQIKFEVKEVDGAIYNNKEYIYIKNQYSKVFLMSKIDESYYVINMDNISYLKFH